MNRKQSTDSYEQLLYEVPAEGVARITLNRPDKRNAQGVVMTYELDAAFKRACMDDNVRVIILAASGVDFCSGHDLSFSEIDREDEFPPIGLWSQTKKPGWEWGVAREKEIYLDITQRWRDAPKPTIAAVQGRCIAGGVMLAFACDLIVAAENAKFRDHTVEMGVCGAEFFNHPFELGIRKAKEWLFTSDWLDAREAYERGMANHVVEHSELESFTLDLAKRIAQKPLFALRMTKLAMNAAQDAMGRQDAQNTAFALHQLCHAQNMLVHGFSVDPSSMHPKVRESVEALMDLRREAETRQS